jgi:hypothetical protein
MLIFKAWPFGSFDGVVAAESIARRKTPAVDGDKIKELTC